MTMIEAPEAKPRPKRRPAKRRAAPRAEKKADEFAGLTANTCCIDCGPDRCVISGIGVCAHPMKGGMQATLMHNPAVVDRHKRAAKKLAHARVDAR